MNEDPEDLSPALRRLMATFRTIAEQSHKDWLARQVPPQASDEPDEAP